jgi:hypothetical protein
VPKTHSHEPRAPTRQPVSSALTTALFGTAAACLPLAVWTLLTWHRPGAAYLLVGAALYLVATIFVTIAFNVPRNNALAVATPSSADAGRRWTDFVTTWTTWNRVRTVAALVAAALLTIGFCMSRARESGEAAPTNTIIILFVDEAAVADARCQLAQINIARMRAPLSDPIMADFVANLKPINEIADASPGFVWRFKAIRQSVVDSGHDGVVERVDVKMNPESVQPGPGETVNRLACCGIDS